MRKLFSLLIYIIVCVFVLSTVGCASFNESPKTPPQTNLPSGKIALSENIGYITGPSYFTKNNTLDNFNVGGTDLGWPVYDSKTDEMYMFFGDTFNKHITIGGDWRSNVMGVSKDFNLSDGLDIIGFYTEEGKKYIGEKHKPAIAVIEGLHNKEETSKLPTGAIEVNGNLYVFYVSKYTWNFKEDSANYNGVIKSTDGGNTWERVYDLSWANHGEGNGSDYGRLEGNVGNEAEDIEYLINQDVNGVPNVGNVKVKDHNAYFFTYSYPVDGKDGYIYVLGYGGYRTHGAKMMRVAKENFEDFSSYEYFDGYEIEGSPIWLTGQEGRYNSTYNNDNFIIGDIEDGCSPASCVYNPYLQKWVLSYLNVGYGIAYSLADNIWGPYSEKEMLLSYNWDGLSSWNGKRITSIYGAWSHEKWMQEDGKIMYFIYSQYTPVYNSSIMKVTFE